MRGSAILLAWLVSPSSHERNRGMLKTASSGERHEEESSFNKEMTKSSRTCIVDGEFHDIAAALASKLSIPLVQNENIDSLQFSHALSIIPYEFDGLVDYSVAIQAVEQQPKSTKRRRKSSFNVKPFFIDFCPPISSHLGRRGRGETGPDLLIKAVAPRKGEFDQDDGAIVYDLTAGFGQDSLLICKAGAKHVHMVERDPTVAALLEDALRRTRLLSEKCGNPLASDLAGRLSLQVGDGRETMKQLLSKESVELPHIVYLDPMFPARTKSASVKKNMQILHGLLDSQGIHDDTRHIEETELFIVAYQAARTRLVVKRPANAEHLGGRQALKPSYSIRGSVNRWDIYIKEADCF